MGLLIRPVPTCVDTVCLVVVPPPECNFSLFSCNKSRKGKWL